jgi:two-component system, sensor histidine kinase
MSPVVNPADPPEVQNRKLVQIVEVLMRRVEQSTDDQGVAYAQFQRAVLLEDQVKQRTRDLERALDLLNESNARLSEATREAQAARQNLANAIETVQEGFALFDADDLLVMCNSRFGVQMSDVHPRLRPGLHFVDYVSFVSQSHNLVLKPGETPEGWAFARMRRHSDRHVIMNVQLDQDRWFQVSEHRTRDGGTVILQTDLTDVIRLERQERGKLLDDQARIIRATLDHISQGVGIFDSERRLVGWNGRLAELLAIPVGRLRLGTPFATLTTAFGEHLRVGGAFTVHALAEWVNSTAPRPPLSFEVNRDDGYVLAAFAQEMPDRGFVMSFSDITAERSALRAISEAKETLEQRVTDRTVELAGALAKAERANAARSRFVAAASHDLLQPLSAAKLFLAAISDEALTTTAHATLGKAQKALSSVEDILGALLDISKLESDQAAVSVGVVRLDQILSKLRDEFTPVAEQAGLRLDILPCSAAVESDPTYLRRILQNLIGNALRYTTSGRVLVGARRLRGAIRLEVLDTGPGIPEQDRTSIFREFHRLNARASASEGMGLGLTIVERACALLGHPLALESRVGFGTRFSVTVPLASGSADAPMQLPPAGDVQPDDQSNQIVLLVENDADLRRAIFMLLEKWGLSVIDVENAEEALGLLDEIDIVPDRFLIDYQLGGGMDGLDLVAILRARYGNVPLRIITAQRSDEIAKRNAEVAVLQKPLDSKALAAFLFGGA